MPTERWRDCNRDSNDAHCTVSMNFELHYYHALVGVINQSGCGLWGTYINVCKRTLHFQILDLPL